MDEIRVKREPTDPHIYGTDIGSKVWPQNNDRKPIIKKEYKAFTESGLKIKEEKPMIAIKGVTDVQPKPTASEYNANNRKNKRIDQTIASKKRRQNQQNRANDCQRKSKQTKQKQAVKSKPKKVIKTKDSEKDLVVTQRQKSRGRKEVERRYRVATNKKKKKNDLALFNLVTKVSFTAHIEFFFDDKKFEFKVKSPGSKNKKFTVELVWPKISAQCRQILRTEGIETLPNSLTKLLRKNFELFDEISKRFVKTSTLSGKTIYLSNRAMFRIIITSDQIGGKGQTKSLVRSSAQSSGQSLEGDESGVNEEQTVLSKGIKKEQECCDDQDVVFIGEIIKSDTSKQESNYYDYLNLLTY